MTTTPDASRRSTDTLPPDYHPERLPRYAPPAPATNKRFAKHDNALSDLYDRCAEEQAIIEASQREADAYIAERAAEQADPTKAQQQQQQQHSQQDPRMSKDDKLNPLEKWNRWSAKFYAPNLYKDSKKK